MGSGGLDHLLDLWLGRFTVRSQAGVVLCDRSTAEEITLLDQQHFAADLRNAPRGAQPSRAPADNSNLVRGH